MRTKDDVAADRKERKEPTPHDPRQKPAAAAPEQKPTATAPEQKPPAAAPEQKPAAAAPEQKPPATAPDVSAGMDLLSVTIRPKTGQIVKIEGVDSVGGHHELTDRQLEAELGSVASKVTLETLIEQAFEAGIACVLGEAPARIEAEESEDEANLRHLLLDPLMKHGAARNLMQHEVLSRAFVGTVARHAITPGSSNLGSGLAQQGPGGAAGKKRRRDQSPGRRHGGANLPHQGG